MRRRASARLPLFECITPPWFWPRGLFCYILCLVVAFRKNLQHTPLALVTIYYPHGGLMNCLRSLVAILFLTTVFLFSSSYSASADTIYEGSIVIFERDDQTFEDVLGISNTYDADVRNIEYDNMGRPAKIDVYDGITNTYLGTYTVTYSGDAYYINGVYAGTYEYLDGGNENTASQVVSEEVTKQSSRTTKRILGKRIAALMAPRPSGAAPGGTNQDPHAVNVSELGYGLDTPPMGLAAGDAFNKWGAWANGSVTKMANYSADQKYNGAMASSLAGIDYKLRENLVFGVAAGYEYTSLNTEFNDGELRSNGFTVAPYAAYAILDSLVVDVTAAFTLLSNDTLRNRTLFNLEASYYSFRSMISSSINWYHVIGNWTLNANTGFMYANEYSPEYTEEGAFGMRTTVPSSNAYVGEWSWGGRIGYLFSQMEPYVSVTYLWDAWMSGPSSQDPDEFEASIGVNLMASSSFLVTFELTNSFARDDVQNTSFMTSLRYEF